MGGREVDVSMYRRDMLIQLCAHGYYMRSQPGPACLPEKDRGIGWFFFLFAVVLSTVIKLKADYLCMMSAKQNPEIVSPRAYRPPLQLRGLSVQCSGKAKAHKSFREHCFGLKAQFANTINLSGPFGLWVM